MPFNTKANSLMWNINKIIFLLSSIKSYTVKKSLNGKLKKGMIVRHDIDWSIDDAYNFFLREKDNNINSTYYVRTTTDLYNINTSKNRKILFDISKSNEVGLHFDSTNYTKEKIIEGFKNEIDQLSNVIGSKVCTFSDHIPSKHGIINIPYKSVKSAYSKKIFELENYISDSRYEYIKNLKSFIDLSKSKLVYFLSHPEYYVNSNRSYKSIVLRLQKLFNQRLKKEISYNNPNFFKYK